MLSREITILRVRIIALESEDEIAFAFAYDIHHAVSGDDLAWVRGIAIHVIDVLISEHIPHVDGRIPFASLRLIRGQLINENAGFIRNALDSIGGDIN